MRLKPIEAGCMALVLPGLTRVPDLTGQTVHVVRLAEASERGSIGMLGNVWIIDNDAIRGFWGLHSSERVACHESRLMRIDGGDSDAAEPAVEELGMGRELDRVET